MNSSYSYFQEKMNQTIFPTCIVYSTKPARDIIAKNNLTPSELLRPFADFTSTKIPTPFGENEGALLSGFHFDLYDNDQYQQIKGNKIYEYINNLLSNKNIRPCWSLLSEQISKMHYDAVYSKIRQNSFPWYNEFEKLMAELMRFNEHEMMQTPFANFFMCSIKDDVKCVEDILTSKSCVPSLIYEGIYESPKESMIILLNDMKDPVREEMKEVYCSRFKEKYKKDFFVVVWDINDESNNDNNSENFKNYFHKLDIYSSEPPLRRKEGAVYGKFISNSITRKYREDIWKFFNNYIFANLKKEVEAIKAMKSKTSKFFLSEKYEEHPFYRIYKFTDYEKKKYLLGIYYFYFRNYDSAHSTLKSLISEIKNKSPHHKPFLGETCAISQLLNSKNKKEVDLNEVYLNHLKEGNFHQAIRFLLLHIRVAESSLFDPISGKGSSNQMKKLIMNAITSYNEKLKKFRSPEQIKADIIIYLVPMLYEKIGLYYLMKDSWFRKFLLHMYLSGLKYCSISTPNEMKNYALNSFGNLYVLISDKSNSFVALKNAINRKMGKLCEELKYFEGGFQFSKNCLELNKYATLTDPVYQETFPLFINTIDHRRHHRRIEVTNNHSQEVIVKSYLENLKEILKDDNRKISASEVQSLSIPEVDNTSLLIIEKEDYDIINALSKEMDKVKWTGFNKYTPRSCNQKYVRLDDSDIAIARKIDNMIANIEKVSDFSNKKNFSGIVGEHLYIGFYITNPLRIKISISSISLLCSFRPSDKTENSPENPIEFQTMKINLDEYSKKYVLLSLRPLIPGEVVVRGVSMMFLGSAKIEHYFSKKRAKKLYSYRIKRKQGETPTGEERSTQYGSVVMGNKNDIIYNVSSPDDNIVISFPEGKILHLSQYELKMLPIKISNRDKKIRIDRFTLFFNESEPKNAINKVTLSDYITFEIPLSKEETAETIVYIPIICSIIGKINLKIFIKFEEENKLICLPPKRFLVQISSTPGIKFNVTEEISKIFTTPKDEKKTYFNLNINAFIVNREKLSSLEILPFFFGVSMTEIANAQWKPYKNKNYDELYNDLSYVYTKNERKKSINEVPVSSSILFDSEFSKAHPYIINKLEQMIEENNFILIPWKAQTNRKETSSETPEEKDQKEIKGIYFYKPNLEKPFVDGAFLKNVFSSSVEQKNSYTKIGPVEYLVIIEYKINCSVLKELEEILDYVVEAAECDSSVRWLGLKKYQIINEKNVDTINLTFSFITHNKGELDMDRILITVRTKWETVHLSMIPKFSSLFVE